MTFEDIHDLERIVEVTKEDDVALERETPNVSPQLGPRSAQRSGQPGKMVTLGAQLGNEALAGFEASGHASNVFENFNQGGFDRRQKSSASHSQPVLRKRRAFLGKGGIEVLVTDKATARNRIVQPLAQRVTLAIQLLTAGTNIVHGIGFA